jgi:putative transposase
MTNHVHLFLTPADADSAGMIMKRLGQRYGYYSTSTAHISVAGPSGRGVFVPVLPNRRNIYRHVKRYIELNPVRAGIVAYLGEYRWSSYSYNGQGERADLLSHHSVYQGLGRTSEERQAAKENREKGG